MHVPLLSDPSLHIEACIIYSGSGNAQFEVGRPLCAFLWVGVTPDIPHALHVVLNSYDLDYFVKHEK